GKNGCVDLFPSVEIYVDLPSNRRGVHLSRDPESLHDVIEEGTRNKVYRVEDFCETLARSLLKKHEYASRAEVNLESRYVIPRQAPGQMFFVKEPYDILATAVAIRDGEKVKVTRAIGARVVGFTACPCTQELLKTWTRERLRKLGYENRIIEDVLENLVCATHTQRTTGSIMVTCPHGFELDIEDLAGILEEAMSGRTYTILKRPAEATVVEQAHRKAMFTEDVVREVMLDLVKKYVSLPDDVAVFIQMFSNESVHKHDIVAERTTTFGEIRQEMASATY
ncbi:MAG: GTP cyclohydrolase MptA, partial [Candidatus Bathyarchaeia archaeon]